MYKDQFGFMEIDGEFAWFSNSLLNVQMDYSSHKFMASCMVYKTLKRKFKPRGEKRRPESNNSS